MAALFGFVAIAAFVVQVVQVCLPFNVLIAPSPNNSYDVLVNADAVRCSLLCS